MCAPWSWPLSLAQNKPLIHLEITVPFSVHTSQRVCLHQRTHLDWQQLQQVSYVQSITLSPWVDAADSVLGTEPLLWCSWWTVWQSCILSRLLADALVFYLKHPSKHLFCLFPEHLLLKTQGFQVCSSLLEPHPFSLEILQVHDHKDTKHDKHLSFPDQDRGVRVKMSTNLTGNETPHPFPGRTIISSTMKTYNRWAPSILGLFTFL